MPRFYFEVHDDFVTEDHDGVELPDGEAAEVLAIKSARDLACDQVRKGRLKLSDVIVVKDENRASLFALRFGDAIEVES